MISKDDLRFESHKHLLEIDAAVTELMKLVISGNIQGKVWEITKDRYSSAHSDWVRFLSDSADGEQAL